MVVEVVVLEVLESTGAAVVELEATGAVVAVVELVSLGTSVDGSSVDESPPHPAATRASAE